MPCCKKTLLTRSNRSKRVQLLLRTRQECFSQDAQERVVVPDSRCIHFLKGGGYACIQEKASHMGSFRFNAVIITSSAQAARNFVNIYVVLP
jgi:hypothetical protein